MSSFEKLADLKCDSPNKTETIVNQLPLKSFVFQGAQICALPFRGTSHSLGEERNESI